MKKIISSSLATLLLVSSSNLCTNHLHAMQPTDAKTENKTILGYCVEASKSILSFILPKSLTTAIFGNPDNNSNDVSENSYQEEEDPEEIKVVEEIKAIEENIRKLKEEIPNGNLHNLSVMHDVRDGLVLETENLEKYNDNDYSSNPRIQRQLRSTKALLGEASLEYNSKILKLMNERAEGVAQNEARLEAEKKQREAEARRQREAEERRKREEEERKEREAEARLKRILEEKRRQHEEEERKKAENAKKRRISNEIVFGKNNLPVLNLSEEDFININSEPDDFNSKLQIDASKYMLEKCKKEGSNCDFNDIRFLNAKRLNEDQPLCIVRCGKDYYIPVGHGRIFFGSRRPDGVRGNFANCLLNFKENMSDYSTILDAKGNYVTPAKLLGKIFENISFMKVSSNLDSGVIALLRLKVMPNSYNEQKLDYNSETRLETFVENLG